MSPRFLLCLTLGVLTGVFGVDADEVKSVSAVEGESVSLHEDHEIQDNVQLLWKFKDTLAEIHRRYNSSSVRDHANNGSFRGRLKLNNQTGSLTITNIRPTDSGVFTLENISDGETTSKRFNVTVYAHLPVPIITRDCLSSERSSVSKCVLLCSVLNVTHVSLSWYNESCVHSSISVSDLNIRLSLPLEVKYQDTNTYTCVVNNPITNQTQHLNINELCGSCSDETFRGSVCAIAAAVVLVVLVVLVKRYRITRQLEQDSKEEERIPMDDLNNVSADRDEVSVPNGVQPPL